MKKNLVKVRAIDYRISKFLQLTLVGLMLSTVTYAQPPAKGPVSDKKYTPKELGYELIWYDEFDGSHLDSTKWKVRGVGPRALGLLVE